MQVYPFTITSLFQFFLCEDFLDSLSKMEKRTRVATPLFEKSVSEKKNENTKTF